MMNRSSRWNLWNVLGHAKNSLNSTSKELRDLIRKNTNEEESFVSELFESKSRYDELCLEFDQKIRTDTIRSALSEYSKLTGSEISGAIDIETARFYYALVREMKPEVVIETGVCNGVSSLVLLMALKHNGTGSLISVDFPYYADESLAQFRSETFDEYGGAAIPADKEPGWIVPETLRERWDLRIGKSQRILPEIVTNEGDFQLFIHDSEHSHPCMMYEYEMAHEWIDPGGIIMSDDINWNSAFEVFVESRELDHGIVCDGLGYAIPN